ncbi:hypothetical protein HNQ55_001315 [Thalassotalea piscium]|uniref:Uncharacterized protein n=1 Tax=Thalassotalea piscium TaxID=1230533 RepID=A0A7X0NG42_9GAMM|nr:hypothetical protein [Thalassotalea piscium]
MKPVASTYTLLATIRNVSFKTNQEAISQPNIVKKVNV